MHNARLRPVAWAVAMAVSGMASTALAEEPGSERLQQITVTGGMEQIDTVPGSAHEVAAEEIREQGYDDVHRALQRVPGVYTRGEDGYGIFPNISLRGVDTGRSAKVTVMEDGILMAPAPYSAPAAYYSPATARMDGIEVLKGSSQVRHGPHTTGGVVNYLSTPIPTTASGYVRTQIGNQGDLRTHAWYGDRVRTESGRFGYLIENYSRRNDGFKSTDRTDDFRADDRTGFSRDEPMVKLSWEPDGAQYQYFEFRHGRTDLSADETYLGLSDRDFRRDPHRRYAASRFDGIETDQRRTHLRHYIALNDAVDLTTTVYQNEFSRAWYKLHNVQDGAGNEYSLAGALAGQGDGAGLDVLRGDAAGTLRVRNNARDYESSGVDAVSTIQFTTGELEHDLALGVRYHMDEVRRDQHDDFYTQEANGTISARTSGPDGGAGDRLQETTAVAVFARDSIRTGDWTFTPGIRIESLDMKYEDFQNDESDSGSLTLLSGGLGISRQLDAEWTAFGGLHRGVSPPGPRAAIRDDLDEETSTSLELGARYRSLDGALAAQGVAFRTEFRNLVAIDNVGGVGSGDAENLGKADATGLEFELAYDAGIANGWSVRNPSFVSLTWTDARLRTDADDGAESIFSGARDGNRVPYVPEWQLSAGTGLAGDRWSVNASATYVDSSYATGSNTSDAIDPDGNPDARYGETDSYTTLDLAADYRPSTDTRLFVGVHNALDETYVASRLPHGPRPGLPRFVYAGLEVKF